jgi:YgiT-type zinc finger domain-containing protein
MTTKTEQHTARCAVCGGTLRATTITHEERRGDDFYLFQNVPAKACDTCGELWIDEEVLQEVDRLITKGVPVRTVETPVYDFTHTLSTPK